MELSGKLGSSKQRWSNVHNDMKSTSVDWLMVFGMEGKSGGVLVPVRMEMPGPPTGMAAGFSCPADPSTPAAGRGAGPSKSSGSSKRNWELCDDSTTETSAGLSKSVSTTVVGLSTVTGPSPVAEPSPVAGPLPVAEPSPVAGPLPVAEPWSGRCLWLCRCALPDLHSWPSRRLLPGPHLPSRPLPGPGLELLGPIQYESVEPARQSPWSCVSQGPWTLQEIAGHPVWRQTSHPSCRSSLVVSRGDLRSGDAHDEDDERDRRSPKEWCWWWREEELDGWVSDAFKTQPDSARLS